MLPTRRLRSTYATPTRHQDPINPNFSPKKAAGEKSGLVVDGDREIVQAELDGAGTALARTRTRWMPGGTLVTTVIEGVTQPSNDCAMPLPEQKASSAPTVGGMAVKPAAPAGSTSIWMLPHWNTVPQTEHSAAEGDLHQVVGGGGEGQRGLQPRRRRQVDRNRRCAEQLLVDVGGEVQDVRTRRRRLQAAEANGGQDREMEQPQTTCSRDSMPCFACI